MRKILIVLTLIVSSFFVFNTSVKAATIETNLYSSYYPHINESVPVYSILSAFVS